MNLGFFLSFLELHCFSAIQIFALLIFLHIAYTLLLPRQHLQLVQPRAVTFFKVLNMIRGLTRFEKHVDDATRLYFEDVVQRVKGPLLFILRQSKKNFRPFVIRLLVLGTDERSARPCIVIFCPACVSGLVENFFLKDSSKRLCQPGKAGPASFNVVVEGHPIRPTTSQYPHTTSISTGHSMSDFSRFGSARLKIDGIHGTRYATLGGHIVVINKDESLSWYGLTAGHSIVQDVLEEEVQGVQASEDLDIGLSLFSGLTISSPSHAPEVEGNRAMSNTAHNLITDSQALVEWSGTATIASASFSAQAYNRDWALLEAVDDQSPWEDRDEGIFEKYVLGDSRLGTMPIDAGVQMGFQTPLSGKLSRLPSFVLLSNGNDFVPVHTITMRNARGIPAGTSGTWVYTETSKPANSSRSQSATASDPDDQANRIITVYGQTIADDSLGDVYMVPLCDILNDIKDAVGARGARLPESNTEVDEILRRVKDTTINASQTQVDNPALAQPPINEAEATSSSLNRMSCTQCGSEGHTRETCGVKDSYSGYGNDSQKTSTPVVAAPYIPTKYSSGDKGTKIWYCSECGDGPIGVWQLCCTNCSHRRCGVCVTEVHK